jgi:hypothetical protein
VLLETRPKGIVAQTVPADGGADAMREGGAVETVDADGSVWRHGSRVLAKVAPARGRLLAFPHDCPHEGLAVVSAPKLLLRGELY